ncbi:MAG: hypothetical protein HC809_08965 [Gammaproteobacteria bacterium]|nr:hypothetical protein [Gammaproteobacteria bacterium]
MKWHMLRQRKSDAAFQRANLAAALRAGVACEVDIVFTADDHPVCLHDRTLDRETTGTGRVSDATRATVEGLRQRGQSGEVLADAPLFLDEVVAAVVQTGSRAPAQVQLDIKTRARDLTAASVVRIGALLGGYSDGFIASAYEWDVVERMSRAVPGLHAGFDPLAFYPRSFELDADGFRTVAARTLATAPSTAIYYLEAKLILAAAARGVDLIAEIKRAGAKVDAWTIDVDHPARDGVLRHLIRAQCDQITSNDAELLTPIITAIARGPS